MGATGCAALPSLPDPPADTLSGVAERAAEPGPVAGRCFRRHLEEAITLNRRRLPVYSEWSAGASEPLSRRLIRAERWALLAAWYVDDEARRYGPHAEALVCDVFVSMSLTPPLGDGPEPIRAGAPPTQPDPDVLAASLTAAYGRGGFGAVALRADTVLAELDEAPGYTCMTRHLVESIARLAALSPAYDRAATRAGYRGIVPLSELLLRLHLAALPRAAALDREAAPLQARGVPILCRDVPPIHRPPER